MVKIIENKTGGVTLQDTENFIKNIEKRVFDEWKEKKIVILNQGSMSNREFKVKFDTQFDEYKKELKKLLRSAYKNVFNPIKTLEGLEYLWYKYIFIGVLDEEYVEMQRNRMYKAMEYPSIDIQEQALKIKQKINKRFKKS